MQASVQIGNLAWEDVLATALTDVVAQARSKNPPCLERSRRNERRTESTLRCPSELFPCLFFRQQLRRKELCRKATTCCSPRHRVPSGTDSPNQTGSRSQKPESSN